MGGSTGTSTVGGSIANYAPKASGSSSFGGTKGTSQPSQPSYGNAGYTPPSYGPPPLYWQNYGNTGAVGRPRPPQMARPVAENYAAPTINRAPIVERPPPPPPPAPTPQPVSSGGDGPSVGDGPYYNDDKSLVLVDGGWHPASEYGYKDGGAVDHVAKALKIAHAVVNKSKK